MRKIYNTNQGIDIYIDLLETSYHDPETQKWLWDKAKVVYSGLNTSPLMFLDNKVTIGWEDDGHICFDSDCPVFNILYFEVLLRDGQSLLQKIQKISEKG